MKYALYCRVSTREQDTQAQKSALEEYAKRCGYEYEVFDEVESTRKTRPVKQELLQRLRQREFDGVIVWKLDRWARSTSELILEVNELHERKIAFVSLRDNIDLSTATGKLMFGMLAALAEFEREIIRERTFNGLDEARRQGKILGRREGSKDKGKRRKSGYYLRWAKQRKPKEEDCGKDGSNE